ncbi:MAG: hypothetical protein Q8Q09_04635 [Deltaproteobacteria bacterium]|nr:hypothetical protein [Deltaproteobacteria bacterium]
MTTVLFIHGLESGPGGRKAQHLAEAGYSLVSMQMPCGRKHVLSDPVVLAAGLVAVATVTLAAMHSALTGALVITGLWVARPLARSALMRRVLKRSLAVQIQALRLNTIDCVVASSFGGAVAIELLRAGHWRGPTVLLCPAHGLVAQRAGTTMPSLGTLAPEITDKILVIQGRQDTVVPPSHARALVSGTTARLLEVDDDHRLKGTATPEAFASWIASVMHNTAT